MAAFTTNTDVIVDVGSADVPCCPHGPTLLFERYTQSKGSRKFYACSAFRDKKACGFFRWAEDVRDTNKGENPHAEIPEDSASQPLSHSAYRKRFLRYKKEPLSQRWLCSTCGLLLFAKEVKEHESKGHLVKGRITKSTLRCPTSLFDPQEDNKTYAQYLFAEPIVKFLIECLEGVSDKTHVLCVGTPRLHEAIGALRRAGQSKMKSLLLDLDWRYTQVYSPQAMCRYNMFNHHFLDPRGEERFRAFLREGGEGLVLVTDPPFGGMVSALANTFTTIQNTWRDEISTDSSLPIVWFFPYFMEKRVVECLPSLTMLDYKVDYDNHNLFQKSGKGGRKKGSPVRIFTNLPPLSFPLSASEGYWWCEKCQRYSAAENRHCPLCRSCTSKDGTTYRHCDACQRCVKATRVHCQTCGACDLPRHKCGQRVGEGCHVCGALDHKRRDCPQRHKSPTRQLQGKRPSGQPSPSPKKKRRTK